MWRRARLRVKHFLPRESVADNPAMPKKKKKKKVTSNAHIMIARGTEPWRPTVEVKHSELSCPGFFLSCSSGEENLAARDMRVSLPDRTLERAAISHTISRTQQSGHTC